MAKIIGIDLGTTNSVVAVMEGGKPKIIPNAEGKNITPSVVDPFERVVGEVAKRQVILKPKRIVYSIKRIMGRRFETLQVTEAQKHASYVIKAGREGMAVVEPQEEGKKKEFTPQEISAMILSKLKKDAEDYLGEKVSEAVITVPAYFDDSQRQATKQAGEIAGLKVARIVNEPTAATLAYGLDKKHVHTVAVYDLGGGTFDISILELGEGVYEVKATNGDTYLGGDDFDKRIVDWLAEEFKKEQGIDLRKDPQALQRLRDSAERAKVELSSTAETEINQPFITQGKDGNPLHLTKKITRAKLEQLVDDLIEKTFGPVEACFKDTKLEAKAIDEVILVGGQTRMPKIQERVREFFGKEPHKGINPDEVVALGAAVQAGVLGGEVTDIVLLDVTPLTLGIETLGGVATPMIVRNTTIPTSKTEIFSTAADNQTQVEIHVLQGERPLAANNKSLGRFILDGIPPAPRGVPQIEVKFDIDANGILNVQARDKATGKEQSIVIKESIGLSEEEIERMRKDAQAHKTEDEKKKELVESRNQADNLAFSVEKFVKENKDKLADHEAKKLTEDLKALRDLLGKEDGDKEEIDKAREALTQEWQRVGAGMHGPQQTTDKRQQTTEENKREGKTDGSKDSDKEKKEAEEGEVVG